MVSVNLRMHKLLQTYCLVLSVFVLLATTAKAQELDDLESLLNVEVENIDPVYKPVIAVGSGILSYYGDIKNNYQIPTMGDLGFIVNISAYIDDARYFRGNLYYMLGSLSGNQRGYESPGLNFNFRTDINTFGITVDYDFDHLINRNKRIHPFVAIGIENIIFNTKTDNFDSEGRPYVYQLDGTITDSLGNIIHRDYEVDTDLKLTTTGNNFILAMPLEVWNRLSGIRQNDASFSNITSLQFGKNRR
jgi:hypothetical protein